MKLDYIVTIFKSKLWLKENLPIPPGRVDLRYNPWSVEIDTSFFNEEKCK